MAEFGHLLSSQGSQHDGQPLAELPSSSPLAASTKPRRPPTVTPKRFNKFFTPRHGLRDQRGSRCQSRSARQLRDITRNAVNRKVATPGPEPIGDRVEDVENQTPRRSKRRKMSPALESSPLQPSPSKRASTDVAPIRVFCEDAALTGVDDIDDDLPSLCDEFQRLPTPISRLRNNGTSHRLLQRSFGGPRAIGRGRVHDTCSDWQDATSNFYSLPKDSHSFRGSALPFCTATCHSNSMVAIGDEDGGVRLVDSQSTEGVDFAKAHVSFRPHQNAVMDIAFSSDDYLFATASGDQTARVIDMRTQQTRYIMAGHCSSVKQVRFQPGNDSVLATSSRDGSVQIWDLRCRGSSAPQKDFRVALEPEANETLGSASQRQVVYANTCISIKDAHSPHSLLSGSKITGGLFDPKAAPARRAEVSITALAFMPQGREHLFLTASEANASIKLWDVRGRYTSRGPAMPVSSTQEPDSHVRHRRFGLSSLALSGDGGRLYALCKDSTVYAYSTNHLILGSAPDMSCGQFKYRRGKDVQTGLGPMYGFRHPQFKATSFYVKAAIRPAKGDKEEMLAVGSRDGCAVLFPTDESLFKRDRPSLADEEHGDLGSMLPTRPTARRATSGLGSSARGKDTIPIYEKGTALVRGHQSEVTGVNWTHDGELLTIGDDFSARCWRQGAQARALRTGGESEGRRWNCGWADVKEGYDDDE